MSPSCSDAELVRAAQRGQSQAFAILVQRTQNMARAVAYSSTGDYDSAQDLAQEALVTAWVRLADLKEPSAFRPWLAGIVRNTARYWRRHQSRHAPIAQAGLDAIDTLACAQGSPLETIEREESWRQANAALRVLPSRYREPLLLYYTLDESHEQVAGALGLSEAAVRQRLCRARKKLRDQLEPVRENARRLAAASSVAGTVMICIERKEAWAAPLSLSPVPGASALGSPTFFFGLGALAGSALLAVTAALVMYLGVDTPAATTRLADQASTTAHPQPRATANDLQQDQGRVERQGSTSELSMPSGAIVRIGTGKVKEDAHRLQRTPLDWQPAGKKGSEPSSNLRPPTLASELHRDTLDLSSIEPSSQTLPERASSGGRIRKHGPAIIESRAQSSGPLLKPSLTLSEFRRDLF